MSDNRLFATRREIDTSNAQAHQYGIIMLCQTSLLILAERFLFYNKIL